VEANYGCPREGAYRSSDPIFMALLLTALAKGIIGEFGLLITASMKAGIP